MSSHSPFWPGCAYLILGRTCVGSKAKRVSTSAWNCDLNRSIEPSRCSAKRLGQGSAECRLCHLPRTERYPRVAAVTGKINGSPGSSAKTEEKNRRGNGPRTAPKKLPPQLSTPGYSRLCFARISPRGLQRPQRIAGPIARADPGGAAPGFAHMLSSSFSTSC